jgi:predicted flap endonuclease-1-like 5' DNA nuclease
LIDDLKAYLHIINQGGKKLKGAHIFIIVFVLFLAIGFVGITVPIANWIIQEYMPDILQTDYASLVEGLINGAIYGFIAWAIFTVANTFYKKSQSPKERVVKATRKTAAKPEPSSARVQEIEGIGPSYARKLNNNGINTTDELLDIGGTKQGRKDLAKKTGISETIILEWVNMADLFRIKGIGEEYSELLKEAGVNTVVELARRNPENLQETLVGVNDAKKLVRRPPSLSQTKDWIEQAKTLPRKVEY